MARDCFDLVPQLDRVEKAAIIVEYGQEIESVLDLALDYPFVLLDALTDFTEDVCVVRLACPCQVEEQVLCGLCIERTDVIPDDQFNFALEDWVVDPSYCERHKAFDVVREELCLVELLFELNKVIELLIELRVEGCRPKLVRDILRGVLARKEHR